MAEAGLIDAHVHFWDPERLHYPWLSSEPRLNRRFVPSDLNVGGLPVEALVFVQANPRPAEFAAELAWVMSLSGGPAPVAAAVAGVVLDDRPGPELDELAEQPRVAGVRRLIQDQPAGFALAPWFVEGVRAVSPRGLVFDVCVRQHQVAEATALVESCPDVVFVLDHLGKPHVGTRPDPDWLRALSRLARLPNVACKLSGLTSEVTDPGVTSRERHPFRPYLSHALEAFGPLRCMFGSDWPVSGLTVTYEGWFDHVHDVVGSLTAQEREQVLRGTATRIYRLPARGEAPGRREPMGGYGATQRPEHGGERAADGAH